MFFFSSKFGLFEKIDGFGFFGSTLCTVSDQKLSTRLAIFQKLFRYTRIFFTAIRLVGGPFFNRKSVSISVDFLTSYFYFIMRIPIFPRGQLLLTF